MWPFQATVRCRCLQELWGFSEAANKKHGVDIQKRSQSQTCPPEGRAGLAELDLDTCSVTSLQFTAENVQIAPWWSVPSRRRVSDKKKNLFMMRLKPSLWIIKTDHVNIFFVHETKMKKGFVHESNVFCFFSGQRSEVRLRHR